MNKLIDAVLKESVLGKILFHTSSNYANPNSRNVIPDGTEMCSTASKQGEELKYSTRLRRMSPSNWLLMELARNDEVS